MKHKLLGLLFLSCSTISFSQVGIGTNTPAASAMLEVSSSDKGFLLPRMTSAQRSAIVSPANGLQVYDTNTNSIWYFNGTYWVNTLAMASVGDVKSGVQTVDHSGWVLLDGRPISSLSPGQQVMAASLGFTGNLPNANNAYLVQNGGGMGTVSGANNVVLTQGNLPNVNFTGTAASAGAHSHDVDPAVQSTSTQGNHSHGGTTNTAGNHAHNFSDYYYAENQGGSWGWAGSNNGADFDNMGWSYYHATEGAGNHSHTITTDTQGNHTHTVDIPATTSTTTGNHTHTVTVASGGSAVPVNIAPKSLTVNMFIYLGL